MKHRTSYRMVIVIFIISFLFSNVAFAKPQEIENKSSQNLNNIALCYHGFTTNEAEKSEYVSYLQDFQEQVNYLKDKGFTFVPPSKYNQWYSKKYIPDTPIATIIFDDARESVDIAANWLVENEIPFGIAIIGRRLGTINPEDGYMSWAIINAIYNTEYCEILSHTYNMHHFDLKKEDTLVVSAPILEGPSYVDNGDFLYINSDDKRWYWDLTHIDDTTWSFPLFGTDRKTSQPITSTIKFKAKESVTVNKMRVWAALHSPYSSGYNAAIKIDINGTEVANKTINTTQYETRSQWPEREFVTIDFDNSYTLEANKTYTMTFATQSVVNSSFNIYSIPNFSGDYELTTSSTGMSYGEQEKWPAQPCVILAGDNGKEATQPADSEFQYVPQYKVSSSEGTDVYPSGINIDKYEYTWEYSSPYTGPGKAFLEILSSTPGMSVTTTQICYPFGAYYSKQTNNKQDISPVLKRPS